LPKDAALRDELAARPLPELYQELQVLDPERAAQLHPNDRVRVGRALEIIRLTGRKVSELYQATAEPSHAPALTVMLDPPRPALQERIARRVTAMLQEGLVAEVQGLLTKGCPVAAKPMQSIGYREVSAMLTGTLPQEKLAEQMVIATNQYAKRQQTWFQKTPVDVRLTDPVTETTLTELIGRIKALS
jgi:tRNA dimethylallyltransferase